MTILRVISNGHGEDKIAAQLIQAIGVDKFTFDVYPLVGSGDSYRPLGVDPKLMQKPLPSGGFLLRFKDIINDFKSGLLTQFQKQRRSLYESNPDFQIVVGDVFALFMACYKRRIPTVFFPTAKSERAIPHIGLEFSYIRRNARLAFPRDIETHQVFSKKRIPSRFYGNPMFDHMSSDIKKSSKTTVVLLPGSRSEALQNITLMLAVIGHLVIKKKIRFIFSLPPHFQYAQLKPLVKGSSWILKKDTEQLLFQHSNHHVSVSYNFFDSLQQASVVIGLAGTANEQAMHAKRQLISFIGSGPQSTKKRFLQQHQLIEGSRPIFIDSNDPIEISKQLADILSKHNFHWTPLSDHYQDASTAISDCLSTEFFNSKAP